MFRDSRGAGPDVDTPRGGYGPQLLTLPYHARGRVAAPPGVGGSSQPDAASPNRNRLSATSMNIWTVGKSVDHAVLTASAKRCALMRESSQSHA